MLKVTKRGRSFIFLNEISDGWTIRGGDYLTLITRHMLNIFFGDETVEEANKKVEENYLDFRSSGRGIERRKPNNGTKGKGKRSGESRVSRRRKLRS